MNMRTTKTALFLSIIIVIGCTKRKNDHPLSISWVQSHVTYKVPLFDVGSANLSDITATNSILIKNNGNDSVVVQFDSESKAVMDNQTQKFVHNITHLDTILAPHDSAYFFLTTIISNNFKMSSHSEKDSLISLIKETISSSKLHLTYRYNKINSNKIKTEEEVEKSKDFFIPITELADTNYIPKGSVGH